MLDPCLAYLDPGAGSVLIQLVLGAMIGTGLFFRRSLACVFRIFRRGEDLAAPPPSKPG